jgi:Ca-activated chloride channel family protein
MEEAKRGAKAFLAGLDPRDRVTLQFFDSKIYPPIGPLEVGKARSELEARIDGTIAAGGTALYDAIAAGAAQLRKGGGKDASHRIRAVVAMTDGKDENSSATQQAVERGLGGEQSEVIVFTVGYGENVDAGVLTSIANAGSGGYARGDVASIIQVFRDMAAYF